MTVPRALLAVAVAALVAVPETFAAGAVLAPSVGAPLPIEGGSSGIAISSTGGGSTVSGTDSGSAVVTGSSTGNGEGVPAPTAFVAPPATGDGDPAFSAWDVGLWSLIAALLAVVLARRRAASRPL